MENMTVVTWSDRKFIINKWIF